MPRVPPGIWLPVIGQLETIMIKRTVFGILTVFIVWSVLDFIIHGVILKASYEATADLWRPMDEMKTKMWIMYVAGLISAASFVSIYAIFVAKRTVMTGFIFGLLFGVGVGAGMGYGTYSVMPIPYSMALTRFLGTVVEAAVGGALAGLIVSKRRAPAA